MKTTSRFSLLCALLLLTSVSAATAQVNIDSLEAVYDSLELKGVTVTAAKPMVKMEADKMTYDVQADADANSSTVLDMLRKVPMVTVDGQDNITVNGSSAFKVYVDGKPNPMFSQNASQVFKMMPASAVQKIEVITNPGAKYDAEGAVGVLNIVLARQQGSAAQLSGTTGTVRATVGNQGSGAGLYLSTQQGKFSMSGNMMVNYQNLKDIEATLEREGTQDGSLMRYNQKMDQRTPFAMMSLNMGYDLDSMNVLSATVSQTGFSVRQDATPHIFTTTADGLTTDYSYDMRLRMRSLSTNVSADWQHFFTADRQRFLTLSYLLAFAPQKTDNRQQYALPPMTITSLNKPRSLEQTLQFDYTTPLAPTQTLNLGGKYVRRTNKSWAENGSSQVANSQFSTDNSPFTQYTEYRHTNDIAAAYAEYEAKAGIVGAKAGLRYEHTWQKVDFIQGAGEDFSLDYGNLVPSLSLSLSPTMTQNIGLTYNMRLQRPGITYLNPYVDRTNPIAVSYGNSYLDVEKMHNIGLTYSRFSQSLMLNVGLHQTLSDNQITEFSFYKDDIMNTTYGNVARQRNTSLTAFVNWLAAKNTRLMLNGGLSYVDLRTTDDLSAYPVGSGLVVSPDYHNHGWQGNLMIGLQQTLPWQLKLSMNALTNSRTYSLQGWSSGFNLVVGSLTKSLLNDRLNISLSAVTGLDKGGSIHVDSHTEGLGFTSTQRIKVPLHQVALSVSYTFGNQRVQTRERKSRIENDFMERQSEGEQLNNAGSM